MEIVSDSSRAIDRIQRGLGEAYVETGQFTDTAQIPTPWLISLDLARLVR